MTFAAVTIVRTTLRWSERDSNLWSLFEIGTARAGSNYQEFVRRAAERPLPSERD